MATSSQPDNPSLGRPRDRDRTQAILDAANELLVEVGYDNIRIQDIADRAGTGLGTIYRRWETKDHVLADAIRTRPHAPIPTTGDPAADLRTLLMVQAEHWSSNTNEFPGFIAAMRASPLYGDAIRDTITTHVHNPLRDHVLATGHSAETADLIAEIVPALLIYRSVLMAQPIDPDTFANEITATIANLT